MSALADQAAAVGAVVLTDHNVRLIIRFETGGLMGRLREVGITSRMAYQHPYGDVLYAEPTEPARRGAKVRDRHGVVWKRGTRLWGVQGSDLGRLPWTHLLDTRGPVEEVQT